ncbi:pseudouridine synthase [Thiomicrorhabdus lithotrophica]|uniref:Pseudouridine synthase n=1 Tax=Thiomicrorhabdus lithotrophica TaxID=2949997 RepID=A0ABY8CB97_9GAMM|nr:pseudouridine synthase [Thiomicrorhabdus lithotrophica]WEJ63251.1 rRNA pseudouridine synthase [Thiomicrorhabdus lithotrophica]
MTRINKWLSEMGVCSRKQADNLIQIGEVLVNDKIATVGMLVNDIDKVSVSGTVITHKPKPIFMLYHKPVGVVCTHDLNIENNIEQAINFPQRVFAVGRLDKESEGLMLLTNQGDSVNKIMRSENHHQKVYRVWLDKMPTKEFANAMASGVEILDRVTLPCKVVLLDDGEDKHSFEITLTQGLNLQIRRMCKALGYRVVRLQRIRIMQFDLSSIKPGEYRILEPIEIEKLQTALLESIS